jgi:hypothetical protein
MREGRTGSQKRTHRTVPSIFNKTERDEMVPGPLTDAADD